MRIERDESGRIIRFYQDDGSDIHVEGKDLPAIIDAIGRYESETYSKVTERILGAKKINSVNIKNGIDGLVRVILESNNNPEIDSDPGGNSY